MKNIRNINVTHKLWWGVGAVVLGAVMISAWAGWRSAQHQRTHSERDRVLSLRLDHARQWGALSQVNAVRTEALILSVDAHDEAEFAAQIAQTSSTIEALVAALQASAQDEENRTYLHDLGQQRQSMQLQRTRALQLKKEGHAHASRTFIHTEYRQASHAYLKGLEQFIQHQADGLASMRAEMGAARQGVVRSASVHMLVLMLAISTAAYVLINSIRRSLVQANGVAEQIAAGDLNVSVHIERMDEFGHLLHSLHSMSGSLGMMIEEVRDSGDAIACASAEIASGNHDLSQRTEQTSNHLQHAASAMRQLTHTLHSTAQGAQQAAGLAQRACTVAQHGGTAVAQVVSTMTDIHAHSQKIADITGIIDGIAFQTNILALNAAVEAARAGEQGRGFAVVANEVRQLAQRSAQAAKEIKQLIQESVERVADGERLVQGAGSTMMDVVQAIEQASTVMCEINASVGQQRDSVAQINEAVGALDQMTLQNAALVEQSAAAAHSMHQQSQHLRALVQRFQVPEKASHFERANAEAVNALSVSAGHVSAAWPCDQQARHAASKAQLCTAKYAPNMPANTSPVPALASRALPVGLMTGMHSGAAMTLPEPLSKTVQW